MAKQQTHTERQHQRAQKKKRTQRDHPKDSSVKLTDIPLLNLRIGISVVLTLMSIALALKCFEFPVPGSGKETTINIASVGIDDANIFMTYAQNIAEGHGAVYYPGGPRVSKDFRLRFICYSVPRGCTLPMVLNFTCSC